jgi:hypothetical protein
LVEDESKILPFLSVCKYHHDYGHEKYPCPRLPFQKPLVLLQFRYIDLSPSIAQKPTI